MKNLFTRFKKAPVAAPKVEEAKKEAHQHECACGGNCDHHGHGESGEKAKSEAHQCACGHH